MHSETVTGKVHHGEKWLWMAFVDLEKAFDRYLDACGVVYWWLRSLGVNEWLVSVVQSMYEDATTVMRVNGRDNKALGVSISVHLGSVLSPLLFITVLDALSREFREDLPMEFSVKALAQIVLSATNAVNELMEGVVVYLVNRGTWLASSVIGVLMGSCFETFGHEGDND